VYASATAAPRRLLVPRPSRPQSGVQQPEHRPPEYRQVSRLEDQKRDPGANTSDENLAIARRGSDRDGGQDRRGGRQPAHELRPLLPEQQTGADEADPGQHARQGSGCAVRRQHTDDAGPGADEGEHPVTRARAAHISLESDKIGEPGRGEDVVHLDNVIRHGPPAMPVANPQRQVSCRLPAARSQEWPDGR